MNDKKYANMEPKDLFYNYYALLMHLLEVNEIYTRDDFEEKTGLNKSVYKNIIDGKRNIKFETVLTLCIVLDFSPFWTRHLIGETIYGFNPDNRLQSVLLKLVTNYSGLSLKECNAILKENGLKYFLGPKERTFL